MKWETALTKWLKARRQQQLIYGCFSLNNFTFKLRSCKEDSEAVWGSWNCLKQNFKSSHALGKMLEKKKAFLEQTR